MCRRHKKTLLAQPLTYSLVRHRLPQRGRTEAAKGGSDAGRAAGHYGQVCELADC